MCIINNNNCGRLHDLTLRLKIPMSTLKNFFEIYRKFGHAPSKSFDSPVSDYIISNNRTTSEW